LNKREQFGLIVITVRERSDYCVTEVHSTHDWLHTWSRYAE